MPAPTERASFARRWAELWAHDYQRMVTECYHDDVELFHAGWGDRGHVQGAEALLATEDRLKRLIPDHRNPILRVVDGGDWTVVESCITGTTPGDPTTMACPSVVWWQFADDGRIRHETAYWWWSRRRPDDGTVQGVVPHGDGRPRSQEDGERLAARMAELWTDDPERMVTELYAPDCRFEQMGMGPRGVLEGHDALRAAERRLLELLPRPQRRMTIQRVAVDVDVVAVAFDIEGSWHGTEPVRHAPGTVVLTLVDDRIVSDRAYWQLDRSWVVGG